MNQFMQQLRNLVALREDAALTDGQLLKEYLIRRDQAALSTLVRRHAPMVWGVCCRVLSNHHDAEDAFQATFLVFVRKATSIAAPELLANWLYGVAHQTAVKTRATVAKRKARERQVAVMPEPLVVPGDVWSDLQPLLDQEINRLPESFRVVIVLCDLGGRTRGEAARDLGVPEGTVGSRLARARDMLAKRLARRGVSLSGGALAALITENVAFASVPQSVVSLTISAANLFAAGPAAASGLISPKVAVLTDGVLKAMFMTKLKTGLVLVALGLLAIGGSVLAYRTALAGGNQAPAAERPLNLPPKQEQDKETFTAWGKEVGHLQAGLGYKSGRKAYSHGETVSVVLRIRNVGKESVDFKHIRAFFVENPPTIVDPNGKVLPAGKVRADGKHVPHTTKIAPGKEAQLYVWEFSLQPEGEGTPGNTVISGAGKFSFHCKRVVGPTGDNPDHPNPTMDTLATGTLDLEINPKNLRDKLGKAERELALLESKLRSVEAIAEQAEKERELRSSNQLLNCVLDKVDIAKNSLTVTLSGTNLVLKDLPIAIDAKFVINWVKEDSGLDPKECTLNDFKEGMRVELRLKTEKGRTSVGRIMTMKADKTN